MIKRSRSAFILGWIGLILFPNHDLFNYLFAGTPLIIWKQIVATVIFILAIDWSQRNLKYSYADSIKKRILVAYLFFGALYSIYSIMLGLSIGRIVYGLLAYSGLAGYLYFSSIVADERPRYQVYRAIAILSVFGSIGLIVDYYTGIFNFLPRQEGLTLGFLEQHGIVKRAAFFFGASTTVFQFQSVGILALALVSARLKSPLGFIVFNLCAVTSLFSIYLTGSRAALYLMLPAYCIGYFIVAKITKFLFKLFSISSIVSFVVLSEVNVSDFKVLSASIDRFSEALSVSDEGNSHRFLRWEQGLNLMVTISVDWLFGNGLGSTIGRFSDDIAASTHFESSVLQAFYEGGFGLVIYRYLAAIVAVFIFFRRFKHRNLETIGLASILGLHFVSTAVAPTFGAYHTQLVFFLVSGLLISLSSPKPNLPT